MDHDRCRYSIIIIMYSSLFAVNVNNDTIQLNNEKTTTECTRHTIHSEQLTCSYTMSLQQMYVTVYFTIEAVVTKKKQQNGNNNNNNNNNKKNNNNNNNNRSRACEAGFHECLQQHQKRCHIRSSSRKTPKIYRLIHAAYSCEPILVYRDHQLRS